MRERLETIPEIAVPSEPLHTVTSSYIERTTSHLEREDINLNQRRYFDEARVNGLRSSFLGQTL